MGEYVSRKIRFKELVEINDWKIKVYTITKGEEFDNPEYYKNVLKKLSDWVQVDNSFNNSNYKIGFLILHTGTEGIFSLINWWLGMNMLNTNIYLSEHNKYEEFNLISGHGIASCVWELEIIYHEKTSWTNNVLKHSTKPDFKKYLDDVINIEI